MRVVVVGGRKPDVASVADAVRLVDDLPLESADVIYFASPIPRGPRRRTETPEGLEWTLAAGFLTRLAALDRIHERLGSRPRAPRVVLRARAGRGHLGGVADFNQQYSYDRARARRNAVAGNEALVLGAAGRYPGLAVSALVARSGRLPRTIPSGCLFDGRGRPVPSGRGFDDRHADLVLRIGDGMVRRALGHPRTGSVAEP